MSLLALFYTAQYTFNLSGSGSFSGVGAATYQATFGPVSGAASASFVGESVGSARIYALAAEVWYAHTDAANAAQLHNLAVEVWRSIDSVANTALIYSLAVEVWRTIDDAVTGRKRAAQIIG
jgi:hypothetical protein